MPGEGMLVEPLGSPLERWCLRPGPWTGSAWFQAGWRPPQPTSLSRPSQTWLREPGRG